MLITKLFKCDKNKETDTNERDFYSIEKAGIATCDWSVQSFTPHSSAFFNHHYYTTMLVMQSASHMQLLTSSVSKENAGNSKRLQFQKTNFSLLVEKKIEKSLRDAEVGQFYNSCRCSLQFVSWEFCSNSVHITAKRLLWKCYKNYSIFCSLLIFVAVMSHHRISVFSTLPVSQSHQNA